jgi:hypothetical protein
MELIVENWPAGRIGRTSQAREGRRMGISTHAMSL